MSTQAYRNYRADKKQRKKLLTQPLRIPSDYIWKVLRFALTDCEPYLPLSAHRWLDHAIRKRDVPSYLNFCSAASLQSINRLPADFSLDTIKSLRFMCLAEKFLFPGDELSRDLAAIEKFLYSEELCRKINRRGFPYRTPSSDLFDDDIFENAKKFILGVIGEQPDMEEFKVECRFGPGSNLSTTQSRTSLMDKYQPPYTISPGARTYFCDAILSDHRWLRSLIASFEDDPDLMLTGYMHDLSPLTWYMNHDENWKQQFWNHCFVECNHNLIKTVPKNSKTSRDMAVEPAGNIYLQLGVNGVIRKRLKSWGIDLHTQAKNQTLARRGSLFHDLATIDLSSASNLISTSCIRAMLPEKWCEFLMSLRVPQGRLEHRSIGLDETIEYEKISSMGNGFTFCLESLIFASLVYGVVRQHGIEWREILPVIAVYGDDIIVPSVIAVDVMRVLNRAGFKVNFSKTFISGEIRESCGKDWWSGEDIRGCHIESNPEIIPELSIQRNSLYLTFKRLFHKTPSALLGMDKWIPKIVRLYGPLVESPAQWLYRENPDRPLIWNKRYQRWYWETPRYRMKRSPCPVPLKVRCIFGDLQNDYRWAREPSGEDWKEPWVEKPADRYTPIGRNCPIVCHVILSTVSCTW